MGDWLVIIGAAALVTAAAVMFGDLLELRDRRGDPEAVAAQMERGVIGNRWVRLGVQVIVTAGLVLISVGVVIGV
jgi:hypothetical protein